MKNFKNRFRRYFNKIQFHQHDIPNLLEFQIDSFKQFLGTSDKKEESGIYKVLRSTFPVEIKNKNLVIEFLNYRIEDPEYSFYDCKRNSMTYSIGLHVDFRLIHFSINEKGEREIINFKDQEIFLCNIPMMSEYGSFMINGIERVVVTQMHKSSSVFFGHDKGKTSNIGRYLYNASIVPYRGAWLEFEFDAKDCIYFRIDKKKKLPVTTLLKFLGLNRAEIVKKFYSVSVCKYLGDDHYEQGALDFLNNISHAYFPVIDSKTREVVIKSGSKITQRSIHKIHECNVEKILLDGEQMLGKYIYEDIKNGKGQVSISAGTIITKEILEILKTLKVTEIPTALLSNSYGPGILDTLLIDTEESEAEVVLSIIRSIGVTEVDDIKSMKELIKSMFFSEEKYDLSEVGRFKINQRLNLNIPLTTTLLTVEDVIETVRCLNKIKSRQDDQDDIDNLSNRRLRQVGELVENQFRSGIVKLIKKIQDRSIEINPETCLPVNLLGIKPLNTIIKEFFTLSQLSQFMDQTNPLSSLSHKRRISSLGPGGVNKDRATFEIRDVHMTHYGRLCAIETPEGLGTGLIHAPTISASVDKYGFMTVPYYKVVNGKKTNEVVHLTSMAQYNKRVVSILEKMDSEGRFMDDVVKCRYKDEVTRCKREEIDFVDILPMQIVSLTASHIPFLNNNDAIRSLYGSNMQRQAVPLLHTDSPLVGTGIEKYVVKDTGACLYSKYNGRVDYVDARKIIIINESETEPVTVYNLVKFDYSNHKTFIHQKINAINVGDYVKAGDMIACGQSIDNEEIALGRNVFIAFMPWNGLNYEDAIILSSRLVNEDYFTSVHIETLEAHVRDTKLGAEQITAEVPGVPKMFLSKLDEVGIVRIGEKVDAGSIIVGKVTPKNSGPLTSEEKLLRAIFGDKASNVQNSSLVVPSGTFGTVIDVEIFTRRGVEKDDRTLLIEKKKINEISSVRKKELNIIKGITKNKIEHILQTKIADVNFDAVLAMKNLTAEQKSELNKIKVYYDNILIKIDEEFNSKIKLMNIGHELPQGVLKVIKIYIASKRKIQVGDKMSGRHGNKGIVSSIVNEADMPFMSDGTAVDMVLNSLGIPGRMNIGQILETHLGFASKMLGSKVNEMISLIDDTNKLGLSTIKSYVKEIYAGCDDLQKQIEAMNELQFRGFCNELSKGVSFATPVFDGALYTDIQRLLELAGVDKSGQVELRDGRTGEYFDRKVTVGYKYMLKLHHLVDDKIHARSVGPYSLITQQPVGGKSKAGGQRFGELEFWAAQAHGCAHILQEMYTVKSDDIRGRNKLYSSLVSDENYCQSGITESFKIMLKECAALCLDLNTDEDGEGEVVEVAPAGKFFISEEEKEMLQTETNTTDLEDFSGDSMDDSDEESDGESDDSDDSEDKNEV